MVDMNKTAEELFNDVRESRIDLAEFKKLLASLWEEAYESGHIDGWHCGYDEGRD